MPTDKSLLEATSHTMQDNTEESLIPAKANEVIETISSSRLDRIANKIKQHTIEVEVSFIEIGKLLNQAKALIDHGYWLSWLDEHTDIPRGVAARLMRLAKEFPNVPPVAHLGFTKALLLLDVPADQRASFIEKSYFVGNETKNVSQMSKRELQDIICAQYKPKAKKQKTDAISNPLTNHVEGLMECLDETSIDISEHANKLRKLSSKLLKILAEAEAETP